MQPDTHPISDLVIEECIPNCKQCSEIWVNEHIEHRIVCWCKKCNHGKNEQNSDKSGDFKFPLGRG
jgi:hypothetical protein